MYAAAQQAAEAIDYRGGGHGRVPLDAEDPSRFWFLEMNTRLQVEHPVTELVWGVDLVAMQLGEPADGDRARAATPSRCGCTPRTRPPTTSRSPGVLTRFEIPAGEGIRVDSGYESGSTVSTFYDAMLAKVVCHAPNREAAARKLADTLARARIHGVTTNRDLLVEVLRSEAFLAGEVSTAFLPGGFVTGLRSLLNHRDGRRGGDRAGRAGGRRTHRPARDSGRVAQRAEPAAADRVRRRHRRRVVARS